ncbi:kinetochore protein [Xenorhabdus bovienii]|uniref:kinetochore protein n=1 Tax=Xenorhabdus bovienii TaxID=40576 RepID=UPI002158A046|nr:kinetochore protein [Xenorhabdus bovienii]
MIKKQHIISNRLSQMYYFGVGPYELRKCLQECKIKLIMAGAKADNLPQGQERTLQFLRKLPPKAKLIVSDWLHEHLEFSEFREPGNVLGELLDIIECNSKNTSLCNTLWREVLGFYVSSDCPEIITQFLNGEEIELSQDDVLVPESLGINVTEEDIEQCLSISRGNEIPANERIIPLFVGGLIDVFKGAGATDSIWRKKLSEHSLPLAQKLGNLVTQFETNYYLQDASYIVVKQATPVVLSEITDTKDEIVFIGKVSALLSSGAFFVTPISLLNNSDLQDISGVQAKVLFPHNGEAVGFLNSFSKHVTRGEMAIWKARYQPSDKSAQYIITDYLSRVYPVVELPHPSSEPDAVRDWLLTCYQPQNDTPVVFQLSDGLSLRLPGDFPDPKKYDFDMPLESYWQVRQTVLGSHALRVVTELPLVSEKYDCAEASTWIKRLLKRTDSAKHFPEFSKAQLQNLAHFIAEYESDNEKSYLRAVSHLEQIADTRSFLNDTTQQLLALPEVEAQINGKKQEILARYESEHNHIKQSIAILSEKKIQLENEIADQRKKLKKETERINKALRQQENELDQRIKKTFEAASQAGIETLAQTALLRAIIKNETAQEQPVQQILKSEPVAKSVNSGFSLIVTNDLTRQHQLLLAIEKQALATGLSESLLSSLIATANITPIVGLMGRQTKQTIASLAGLLAGSVWGEVSVHSDHFSFSDLMNSPALVRSPDDTHTMTLGDFLTQQQAAGLASVVELRGFNRTPPETLLPELRECLFRTPSSAACSWTDRSQTLQHLPIRYPILFVLTFTTGKSTFPLQAPLAHQLPIFLAENIWSDELLSEKNTGVTASRIIPELWQAMYADSHQSELQACEPWEPLKTALLPFLSDEKAQAVARLAYGVGRRTEQDIATMSASLAPELVPYIQEITTGESASVLEHLFQL